MSTLDQVKSKWQPYPAYEDSGIDWLDKIPEHWNVIKAQWLFSEVIDRNHPDEPLLSVTQEQGVLPRDESDIRVWNPGDNITGYKLVKPGEFVISLRSFQGGIEYSSVRGLVSPAYVVLHRKREIGDGYFRFLFKSDQFISALTISTRGIREGKNITYLDFRHLLISIPPLSEQSVIANFLTKEISQLDRHIAKKQRLVELLQEKRKALISHAITKGLDPSVPMEDSGVEWLGEIPEQWDLVRLKFIARESTIKLPVKPNDLPYIGLENIESWTGKLFLDNQEETVESSVGTFDVNDVLFGKLRPYLAKAVVTDFKGACTTELLVLRSTGRIHSRFLFYYLLSESFIDVINSMTYGAKMPRANWQQIGNMQITTPSLEEQQGIVGFLDKEIEFVDRLITKVEIAIEKLQEYRIALISAVVTGKIDVREVIT